MSLAALPLFVKLAGRPVILIGIGDAAEAKRRLLERAGAQIVGEEAIAALAIVAVDDPEPVVARLRARGVLVNAVDRADLCDFTLPAIIDRDPVLVAVGTGGVSAGLAAALRQRLEAVLPEGLGGVATALRRHREAIRARWPDASERRRAMATAMAQGGALDLLAASGDAVEAWIAAPAETLRTAMARLSLSSPDPDDLTLRQARLLAQADRVFHLPGVPETILNRARADAPRIACAVMPADPGAGLSLFVEIGR